MSLSFFEDGNILWLQVTKRGTPPAWQGGYDYTLGDTVVPRVIQPGQESIMFQAIAYIGSSGMSEPSFPSVAGSTVVDGGIEWKSQLAANDPSALSLDEYYLINEHLTVT